MRHLGHPLQVQLTLRVSAEVQHGRIERDGAQCDLPIQWIARAQGDRQSIPGQESRTVAVVDGQLLQTRIAAHDHLGRTALGQREVDVDVGPHTPAAQTHGQRLGQIAQVRREVEIAHRQLELRSARLREWQRLRTGVERRAVELEREPWLHIDRNVRRQVGQKGQRELQRLEHVLLLHRLVVETQ